jgi:hypothetical protein
VVPAKLVILSNSIVLPREHFVAQSPQAHSCHLPNCVGPQVLAKHMDHPRLEYHRYPRLGLHRGRLR